MNTSKYETITFGQFQGMINTIAAGQDHFISSLFKRKTRIEAALITDIVDDSGRHMTVYYMVDELPVSNQSDLCDDAYIIEQVLYQGRKVNLTGRGEQNLLEYLNRMNPAGVKFQTRA